MGWEFLTPKRGSYPQFLITELALFSLMTGRETPTVQIRGLSEAFHDLTLSEVAF